MKPETANYLANAKQDLSDARSVLQIDLAKIAARCAYYAAFHAAEALIFEQTGKPAKTHRGVQIAFARLTRHHQAPSEDVARLLSRAYEYKDVADYGSNRPEFVVTNADAESVIASATDFVQWVETLLA